MTKVITQAKQHLSARKHPLANSAGDALISGRTIDRFEEPHANRF